MLSILEVGLSYSLVLFLGSFWIDLGSVSFQTSETLLELCYLLNISELHKQTFSRLMSHKIQRRILKFKNK